MHSLIDRSVALVLTGTLTVGGAAAYLGIVRESQETVAKTNAAEIARHAYTYQQLDSLGFEDVMLDLNADQTGPDTWVYKDNARLEWDEDANVLRSIVGDYCYEVVVGETVRPTPTPCSEPFLPQGKTAEELVTEIDAALEAAREGALPIEMGDGTVTFTGDDGTCYTARISDGAVGELADC